MLIFGFIAVFVGSFIIFNTFSITIAQRVREFGMLRTLGASRGQILRTVIVEAAVIGLIGAVIGIGGGFIVALGINALFEVFEIDLPTTGLVLETRTVIVSLLVGVLVTVAASAIPALRSTRVPPIAALHAFTPKPSRRRRLAVVVVAVALAAVGVALVLAGLLGGGGVGTRAGMIGGGGLVVVIAVSIFSPRLVPPLANVAGWPLQRLRRLTGRLARENSQRNPGRTAVTAAALMIGLALVTFVTVFAAGLKSTVATVVEENFAGGLVIQNTDGFSPIPRALAGAAGLVPGVESVQSVRSSQAKFLGSGAGVTVTAPTRGIEAVVHLDWKRGGPAVLRGLGAREAVVSDDFASAHGLDAGRLLPPADRDWRTAPLPSRRGIRIEARDPRQRPGHAAGDGARLRPAPGHDRFRRARSGGRPGEAPGPPHQGHRRDLSDRRSPQPGRTKESREEQVDSLVNLFYALLGLAILISLFGIANTLALSIHERTRELGMLRAIGMSKRQVRTMVRYEAVITALIGAILGMVLGVIFAALIAQPLKAEGFTLSYPIGSLAVLLVLAALAGVVAAILPARRASRFDVLDSLQYE